MAFTWFKKKKNKTETTESADTPREEAAEAPSAMKMKSSTRR
jgi:hypothetical protein